MLKLKNDNTLENDSDIFERLFVNRVSQKELLYEINNNSNNAHGYIQTEQICTQKKYQLKTIIQ